jgi:hypothetical protein
MSRTAMAFASAGTPSPARAWYGGPRPWYPKGALTRAAGSLAPRRAHRRPLHAAEGEDGHAAAAVPARRLQSALQGCAQPVLVGPASMRVVFAIDKSPARSICAPASGYVPSASTATSSLCTIRTSPPTRSRPSCTRIAPPSSTVCPPPRGSPRSSCSSSTHARRRIA